MPEHEKEKEREKDKEKHATTAEAEPGAGTGGTQAGGHAGHTAGSAHSTTTVGKSAPSADEDGAGAFFAAPLVGFDASEISGTLIVIEGLDGSGRSTQISLLQEWLESEGFSVQTSGLRRSTRCVGSFARRSHRGPAPD